MSVTAWPFQTHENEPLPGNSYQVSGNNVAERDTMKPLSKCFVTHDILLLLYHNYLRVLQQSHSYKVRYFVLSYQTNNHQERAPYFHVQMIPPYNIFVYEIDAIVPHQ